MFERRDPMSKCLFVCSAGLWLNGWRLIQDLPRQGPDLIGAATILVATGSIRTISRDARYADPGRPREAVLTLERVSVTRTIDEATMMELDS
jgi:hypothetical protein